MKIRHLLVFAAAALAVLGVLVFLALRSALGHTSRGTVSAMSEVPCFSRELAGFETQGEISYHIYRQWGRHIAFISGATSLSNLTNFAKAQRMEFVPGGQMDTDLKHMAFTCGVNTSEIVTVFADDDAYARSTSSALGKYAYIRFRYHDGRFTFLFFN